MREAFERNGTPVSFTTASGAYTVNLLIGGVPADFSFSESAVRNFLCVRSGLAVGSSLGKWIMPVPTRMLDAYVILQLCCCKTEKRYGYRDCLFEGNEADWLCPSTASEPCELVQRTLT